VRARIADFLRSDRNALWTLVLAGLAARLIMMPLLDPWPTLRGGDANYYLLVADTLLEHGRHAVDEFGKEAAWRGPGYSFLVAGVFGLGGGPAAIFALQSLFTIASGIVAFLALKAVDRSLAFLAGLLVVASPFHIMLEVRVLAEILYGALLFLGWLLLFRARSAWHAAAAGALIGLAILTREIFVLLPLALIPAALLRRDRWPALRHSAVAILVAYLVVLPWPIRNANLPDGKFQISQGRLGWNLWVGTWERNADWQLPAPPAFPAYAFRSAREEQAVRKAMASNDEPLLRRIAVDRISTDPLGTIAIWLGRYPQLWLGTRSELTELRPARGTAAWSAIKAGLYGLNALLLAAALAGAALALRRRSGLLFFLLPVAYTAAIYLPFHNAETRYSLLALPFLFIFSSLFLVELMRHMRRRPRPAEA
jgi:4-amino-4-deoxy-L-arabinose transferase-like glycosyltransferase